MAVPKTILNKGVLSREDVKHTLEFPKSSDFFSLPSNLITNINGVSGGRVLLGSKASLQAISLIDRQPPLVQGTTDDMGDSFVKRFGENLLSSKSKVSGKVTKVDSDEIVIEDSNGKEHPYYLYDHFNMGRKNFVHNFAKVKVGDKVKAGDIIATSNYTDDKGTMAMGTNLITAVMPYRSNNFEDAWVVTESGARKLDAEQIFRFRVEKKFGVETDKGRYISLFPNKFLNSQLTAIDQDGAIKMGSKVEHGDPILLAFSPKALKSTDIALGKLSKILRNAFKDNAQTWHYDHPGEVVDVSKTGDLITIQIKTKRTLGVGDKISNVFGAKGVTGTILPDSMAPTTPDGKPVDILLNSMSITSRVAPALAVVLGLGKLAQKEGHPIKSAQFIEGSSIGQTIAKLKKAGISDTESLYDPVTGKHLDVLTGPLYFTRLTHIAEDKLSDRGQGVGYSWDMQPAKAEDESSKRLGNLATTALLSHGASAVLRDVALVKATKNDEFWRRLKLGLPAPSPTVPFIFNKFIAHLQGSGIKVDKKGDFFNVLPMTDKDVMALSAGAITEPTMLKIRGDKVTPEPGGLFDPTKVGIMGEKYNHVDLNFKVPNPISEEYLRKLLDLTKKQYEDMIVSGEIVNKLKAINVDSKIKEYSQYLKSGRKTKKDDSLKVLLFLHTLKDHGMTPADLLISKVPIIPMQFRPYMATEDMQLTADANHLYKDLILNTKSLKDTTGVPEDVVQRLKLEQYNAIKAVYGLGNPISTKNAEKGMKGLLATTLGTRGGSAKTTMFQAKVVNKPLDLVGRAVLTPDAKLALDEASIPQEIIWKTYAPFIIRRLVMRGIPATKASEYVKSRNGLAVEALTEELKVRPGIVSRDPSLHKFNLTGFYIKPNADPKDTTIKLNPLVFKSLNADNDGDQLNINIPASDDARQEVIDKMLPSKNLLSPKTFGAMYMPSNEASLGLFQASTENKHNTPKKYKTEAEVVKDFQSGKLDIGDNIEITG